MERTILTQQNAHRAVTVRNVEHPELGVFTFRHNNRRLNWNGRVSTIDQGLDAQPILVAEYEQWEIVEFRHAVTLAEFDELAGRAWNWSSHDPERRGALAISEHEEQLSGDLADMPDDEKERYISNYKKHFSAWLSAQSRCASTAITGGSNFNVRRNDKAVNSRDKRYDEFEEWRGKALKAIAKKQEAAMPAEQKQEEAWDELRRDLDFKLSHPYSMTAQGIYNVVATRASHGNVEVVEKAIAYVREHNAASPRPIITERHKFFKLADVAAENRAKKAEVATRESSEITFPGGRVVQNWAENRLQIIFDEKPKSDIISELKRHGFRWAPSQGAWQRQLTNNAVYSLQRFIMPLLETEQKE